MLEMVFGLLSAYQKTFQEKLDRWFDSLEGSSVSTFDLLDPFHLLVMNLNQALLTKQEFRLAQTELKSRQEKYYKQAFISLYKFLKTAVFLCQLDRIENIQFIRALLLAMKILGKAFKYANTLSFPGVKFYVKFIHVVQANIQKIRNLQISLITKRIKQFKYKRDFRLFNDDGYMYDSLTGLVFRRNTADLEISSHQVYSYQKEIDGYRQLINEYQNVLGYSNTLNFYEDQEQKRMNFNQKTLDDKTFTVSFESLFPPQPKPLKFLKFTSKRKETKVMERYLKKSAQQKTLTQQLIDKKKKQAEKREFIMENLKTNAFKKDLMEYKVPYQFKNKIRNKKYYSPNGRNLPKMTKVSDKRVKYQLQFFESKYPPSIYFKRTKKKRNVYSNSLMYQKPPPKSSWYDYNPFRRNMKK